MRNEKYRVGEGERVSLTSYSAKVYGRHRSKVQNIKRPFYGFRAHLASGVVAATVGGEIYFIILCLPPRHRDFSSGSDVGGEVTFGGPTGRSFSTFH